MRGHRAAIALAILLAGPHTTRADDSDGGSISILNGSTVVEPLRFVGWSVRADLQIMASPTISGHVTAEGGTGNDIQVLVLTETDYVNLKNNHEVRPLYNSGQVTAADVRAVLPESGTYYVVLSNVFSGFSAKTVNGRIKLSWQPSAEVLAQRQAALDAAKAEEQARVNAEQARAKAQNRSLLMYLITIIVCSLMAGGGIVWLIVRLRRPQPAK